MRGAIALLSAALVACTPSKPAQANLNGAGATFPNPLYTSWFATYAQQTGVKINYQSIGSGGGIRQFTQGTVDFGATDGPMTDEQIAAVERNVLHLPTALGAVTITYNLPGSPELQFDGATLSAIYQGQITRWNDPRIAALNPGASLPRTDILPVYRSDGSGTTFIFTDYLGKVSPEWAQQVGTATSVSWPVGLGGKGNEGVTQQVKQLVGTIGYVELIYALSNDLPVAKIKNADGQFVAPSLVSTTAAAGTVDFPADTDFRMSITNPPGAEAYPIASFTWLLVRPDAPDAAKAKAMKDFLEWMVGPEAQDMAKAMRYAPLPPGVAALVKERLTTLKAGGKPLN